MTSEEPEYVYPMYPTTIIPTSNPPSSSKTQKFVSPLVGIVIFLVAVSLGISVGCLIVMLQIQDYCQPDQAAIPNNIGVKRKIENIQSKLNVVNNITRQISIGQREAMLLYDIQINDTCTQSSVEQLQNSIDQIANPTCKDYQNPVCESPEPTICRNANFSSARFVDETGSVFTACVTNIGLVEVYCDLTTDGGGWTVFQRRMDGSVDFHRDWDDYVNGFGTKLGEFWLGLETIYQMMNGRDHELRMDMIDYEGNHFYAKYESFSIGYSSTNYRLSLSGFSGNITNSLSYHDGQGFSTEDADNDAHDSVNCAAINKGGWWYRACNYVNLNGPYMNANYGNRWRDGSVDRYARYSELKFRQRP